MIDELYRCFMQSKGVTTDTRCCEPGMMFFALRGDHFDGNNYAMRALELGCAYVVIDNPSCMKMADSRVILVDNSLKALQQLARFHRRQVDVPVIGITGTNGKTTTKELVAAVLGKRFNVLYTQGNLNNQIGVPLTLLRLSEKHELAVVEMGANHPGDIKELVEIAEPDCGIITNVGLAHLQGFGSLEGVIRTKGELYDYLRNTMNHTIFLDNDNPYLKGIANGLHVVTYGCSSESEIFGEIVACDPYLRFYWKMKEGGCHEVNTRLIGSYNIGNALCAVAVGCHFGISPDDVSDALAQYVPRNNRSQLTETRHNTLIIDAYNANPTSMQAALDNFACMEVSRKMAILGDMKELGEATEAAHREVVEKLDACSFDEVWLIGEAFGRVAHAQRTFADVDEVVLELQKCCPKDYCILLKGSNSMRLSSLVPYL